MVLDSMVPHPIYIDMYWQNWARLRIGDKIDTGGRYHYLSKKERVSSLHGSCGWPIHFSHKINIKPLTGTHHRFVGRPDSVVEIFPRIIMITELTGYRLHDNYEVKRGVFDDGVSGI